MQDTRLQTLRGLACLLLVFYKVVGTDPNVGLQVADGPLRWLNDGLAYVRMPLFTVLSGWVYGLRPVHRGDPLTAFLLGKARRLLMPMLTIGTLFALLQASTPGTHGRIQNWQLLHIIPVNHLWYCEALFWIFLLAAWLDCRGWLDNGHSWALAWLTAIALHLGLPGSPLLALEGTLYLLPYFLAGLTLSRFGAWTLLESPLIRASLLTIALVAVWQLGMPAYHIDRRSVWHLAAGLSLCGLLLGSKLQSRWLARIGNASYPIFLLHIFFTGASRIGLEKMGVDALLPRLLAGCCWGVVGPMVLERTAGQNRWIALLLLGKSPMPVTGSRPVGARP